MCKKIGDTIIEQLGGINRLNAMLGPQLVYLNDGIKFTTPLKDVKANTTIIRLNVMDTYDIEFGNTFKGEYFKINELKDVYCDMLIDIVQDSMGCYLYL